MVPALWRLETVRVLLHAERRRRITAAERIQAVDILQAMPLRVDLMTTSAMAGATLAQVQAHGLTVYDACYLDVAIRTELPLATLDRALCQAAAQVRAGMILPPRS